MTHFDPKICLLAVIVRKWFMKTQYVSISIIYLIFTKSNICATHINFYRKICNLCVSYKSSHTTNTILSHSKRVKFEKNLDGQSIAYSEVPSQWKIGKQDLDLIKVMITQNKTVVCIPSGFIGEICGRSIFIVSEEWKPLE